jgi:uncharacterized protein YbcC (UPF0753/DUF2309 family)
MNLATPTTPAVATPPPLDLGALERACALIAPTWPLDRFIAVNPFWEHVTTPFETVAAQLASSSGAQLLMPRAWYAEQWRVGRFGRGHLQRALDERRSPLTLAQAEALLARPERVVPVRARVMDVADEAEPSQRSGRPGWREFITASTSQLCASYFDDGQAALPPDRTEGLFATWRRHASSDRSPARLMGFTDFEARCATLPSEPDELARQALADLDVPPQQLERYLHGLLLDLNGWAAWCAYRRWTARLAGRTDTHLRELLVIRLAWEWLLWRAGGRERANACQRAMAQWPRCDDAAQDEVTRRVFAHPAPALHAPRFQAVFCIDVRSEVFRRALENVCPQAATLGFAGFFGLPIEYWPVGAREGQPRLPGLLAPKLRAADEGLPAPTAAVRAARLSALRFGDELKASATAAFSFVEAMGPLAAVELMRETFGQPAATSADLAGLTEAEASARRPRVQAELSARADLASGVLRGMSLTHGLSRLVALIGHGSQTRNNPHAAGLDCGACCGQTGEVNARAAAALLNDAQVRAELARRGLEVPSTTCFVAGLHDTTTDEVRLFETDAIPASHADDLAALRRALQQAGERTRFERAARLELPHGDRRPEGLLASLRARARDWAQVRPEWGLADNCAFIVGPRELSRHLDLGGRAFLHDYRWEDDAGFGVLELIMTAPMVVTHWINLQYYASTVDNLRYGSGNKVLHNVVGAHLGVFEGNGGDLRIGLSKQSLQDGEHWVHTPRRLSVFIAAPREAIDGVLAKHATVRALVENEWLFLFQLDSERRTVSRRSRDGWALTD